MPLMSDSAMIHLTLHVQVSQCGVIQLFLDYMQLYQRALPVVNEDKLKNFGDATLLTLDLVLNFAIHFEICTLNVFQQITKINSAGFFVFPWYFLL